MKTVRRGGIEFVVLRETEDEVCVEVWMDFASRPYRRALECWWYKNLLDPVTAPQT